MNAAILTATRFDEEYAIFESTRTNRIAGLILFMTGILLAILGVVFYFTMPQVRIVAFMLVLFGMADGALAFFIGRVRARLELDFESQKWGVAWTSAFGKPQMSVGGFDSVKGVELRWMSQSTSSVGQRPMVVLHLGEGAGISKLLLLPNPPGGPEGIAAGQHLAQVLGDRVGQPVTSSIG